MPPFRQHRHPRGGLAAWFEMQCTERVRRVACCQAAADTGMDYQQMRRLWTRFVDSEKGRLPLARLTGVLRAHGLPYAPLVLRSFFATPDVDFDCFVRGVAAARRSLTPTAVRSAPTARVLS